ncbi:MAG: hypothetical protein DRN54_01660 [Thaumarchaeota archaeon]|nr:MAG: hypothetical protein DRN54_01660 [Nitrososphaerota archaeon]
MTVVGFSRYPEKPAHYVPKFLIRKGYLIVLVQAMRPSVGDGGAGAELLKKNGITAIWNRRMMREHNRLFGSNPLIPTTKLK